MRSIYNRVFRRRRFQAYTVGTAKSGTTSFARSFEENYRAAHEPAMDETLDQILDVYCGEAGEHELDDFVRAQDEQLWLEMNSSQLNYFLLPALLRVFPDAKFVLPIRNPYEWVDSFINHQLGRPVRDEFSEETAVRWERYRDLRFKAGRRESHPPEEKVLEEHDLYTLDGYLQYWAEHNEQVISQVPSPQLLILRTSDIDQSMGRVSEFLGISPSSLSTSKSHANRARERFDLLDQIDSGYVERVVNRHCRPLMDRFFGKTAQDES